MRADVENAYHLLGLEVGASIETVKTAYKQAALRTHPDKNPDDPDATAQFQRLGAAYKLLSSHLEPQDSDEDDFDCYSDDDDFDVFELHFAYFIFEHMMRGGGRGPFSYGQYRRQHPHFPHHHHMHSPHARSAPPPETPEQYAARVKRTREEQAAAAERRRREAAARKLRAEQDRERERRQAEERQKAKLEEKKSKAEAQKAKAEKTRQDQLKKSQNLRSTVFAAARAGNVDQVKKGIWEDNVDAAGGEVKSGSEAFANHQPTDPKETLLHIAAKRGDSDLVAWLDTHSADVEERDSQEMTVFHAAIENGNIPIVTYLLENYSPSDSDNAKLYASPPSKTNLGLAVESCEPELVYMVLKDKISLGDEDLKDTWAWVSSAQGLGEMKKRCTDHEKVDDIVQLLMIHGGFSPPSTPNLRGTNGPKPKKHNFSKPPPPQPQPRAAPSQTKNPKPKKRGKARS